MPVLSWKTSPIGHRLWVCSSATIAVLLLSTKTKSKPWLKADPGQLKLPRPKTTTAAAYLAALLSTVQVPGKIIAR